MQSRIESANGPGTPASAAKLKDKAMQPEPFMPRYPVIVSTINGQRSPNKAEMRALTVRIFGEIRGIGPNRMRRLRQACLIARWALDLHRRSG